MTARIQGCALALYFALLPYVVVSKWRASSMGADGRLIRGLLVVLAALWVGFLCQVVLNVGRLRRGRRVSNGGSAWLAGLHIGS